MPRPKSIPLEKKVPVEFTPARKERYIEHLRENGLFYLAAECAGVSAETAQMHRKSDPEFGRRVDQAKQQHVDTLVAEAQRRAVKGVKRPIIGGLARDRIVAHEQVYSDALMQTLLRAGRAEFGPAGSEAGAAGGANGSGGGVLVVPQAPHSIADWETLYGEKARGTTGRPA